MPITLNDKTVIVTGADRGIGKAIATVFAREDAKVLVVNRSAEGIAAARGPETVEKFNRVMSPMRFSFSRLIRRATSPATTSSSTAARSCPSDRRACRRR